MIANPALEAFRYNPYDKSLTREHYETQKMLQLRRWVRDGEGRDGLFYMCTCMHVHTCCWDRRLGLTGRYTTKSDSEAVEAGRRAQRWGVILGTLGRQVG